MSVKLPDTTPAEIDREEEIDIKAILEKMLSI